MSRETPHLAQLFLKLGFLFSLCMAGLLQSCQVLFECCHIGCQTSVLLFVT